MITAKIGGTSVTPRNLYHLKEILTPFHKCVVVSAVGKEHFYDVKTTDLLREYFYTQSDKVWAQIADKYRRLVEVNAIDVDVDQLLRSAKSRACKYNLSYCMSLGEELSAKTVASYVKAEYIEAEQVVRFDGDKLNEQQTYANISSAVKGANLAVVGGFYGGCNAGRATFSRGGSDVSGAIFAAATDSTLYENWTDVNGVCAANPSKVHGVETIDCMSYDEMLLLSLSGAEVLHPDAVSPVKQKAIPIKIGNFTNPFGASTMVCNCPSRNKLLSIAEKDACGKVETTVLHSFSDWQIAAIVSQFLQTNQMEMRYFDTVKQISSLRVYKVEFEPNVAQIVTDRSILNDLYKRFHGVKGALS